jgi:hypothetical protein
MEFWSNQNIANYSIFQVKRLLLKAISGFITVENASYVLGIKKSNAKTLLNELCRLGYIQYNHLFDEDTWENSTLGNIIVHSTIKRLITPDIAKLKIKEFPRRVNDVNLNPELQFSIGRVMLRTEFQGNSSDIKYLRFAISFEEKSTNSKLIKKKTLERMNKSKKRISNMLEQLEYPRTEILDFLKNGVHNISLRDERGVRYLMNYADLSISNEVEREDLLKKILINHE